jgi:hypothetical protein
LKDKKIPRSGYEIFERRNSIPKFVHTVRRHLQWYDLVNIILPSITTSQHTKSVLTALNLGVDFALGENKS